MPTDRVTAFVFKQGIRTCNKACLHCCAWLLAPCSWLLHYSLTSSALPLSSSAPPSSCTAICQAATAPLTMLSAALLASIDKAGAALIASMGQAMHTVSVARHGMRAQVRSFGAQLLEATAFLHELTLIHTDLKPENILLTSSDYNRTPPTYGSRQASIPPWGLRPEPAVMQQPCLGSPRIIS